MKVKQSLLDKAKSHSMLRTNRDGTSKEEKELILAWVKDEVRLAQVEYALGRKAGAGTYSTMTRILKSIILDMMRESHDKAKCS